MTLARPIARHQAITRTVVLLASVEMLVLLAMTASSWTGLACCTPPEAPRPAFGTIRSLALMLGAVTLCWGGIALAIAAAARRRATASGAAAVAALAMYLVDYLARIWDPARALATLSPFHYFEPMTLISGGPVNLANLTVLASIGIAATVIAYVRFARRDL
jgi:ABC-2 type transport system permease protein